MKTSCRKIQLLTVALIAGLVGVAQAQVIGSWQGSSDDGWTDWGNNSVGLFDASNNGMYSIASGVVAGYTQSLQMQTADGWQQRLAIKLEYTSGDMAAFLNNHLFSITWSIPSAATAGVTGGYEQLYVLSINAQGYGFIDQPASEVTLTGSGSAANGGAGGELDFWSTSPAQSQTLTWDYSSILPTIAANNTPTSGYIELIFAVNCGGGAPDTFYFNNAVLSGGLPVPEPASMALCGFGLAAGFMFLRRRNAR